MARGARRSTPARLNVQREALLWATSAAQTCLIVPWARAVSIPVAELDPLAVSLFAFSGFIAAAWLVRAMAGLRLPTWLRPIVALAGLLIAIGFGLSAVLYPGQPVGSVLLSLAARILRARALVTADIVIIALTLATWWFGLGNARRLFSVDALRSSLRIGVVVWILYVIFNAIPSQDAATPFLAGYFLFALIALALARSEDLLDNRPVNRSPFGVRWFAATCAVALALVAASWLAWSGLSPILTALFWGGLGVLARLVLILVVLAGSLLGLFRSGAAPADSGLLTPPPDPSTHVPDAIFGTSVDELTQVVQAVSAFVFLVILAALVIIVIQLSKRYRHVGRAFDLRAGEAGAARRGGWAGLTQPDGRLRRWARRLRRGPSGWLTELTIRRIYAQLLALGASCGAPRPVHATPYEYLPALTRLLAGVETDVQLITEAYVRAHYGELPDTPEQLGEVRAAFRRVRAEAKIVIDYQKAEFVKAQEKLREDIKLGSPPRFE